MTRVLLIAEHDGQQLNPSTAKALSCAATLGGDIDIAIFAAEGKAVAEAAAQLAGATRILLANKEENQHPLAAILAPQIAKLARDYTHVLAPSTTFGKDLMPRVAGLLGVPQISDIMEVIDPTTFKRPMYAGNVIVTVKAPGEPAIVATARMASYSPAEASESPAEIENVEIDTELPSHTRFIELKTPESKRPDLQSSTRVVSGGRGLGSRENFDIVFSLADKLNAAVGASRAAVDAGYVPNDMQVGQTGKIIAPALYIAAGISGAIQHITGIKDAGTIVAINKDADAPIFEVADLGLVGDLFKILPELEKALDES